MLVSVTLGTLFAPKLLKLLYRSGREDEGEVRVKDTVSNVPDMEITEWCKANSLTSSVADHGDSARLGVRKAQEESARWSLLNHLLCLLSAYKPFY